MFLVEMNICEALAQRPNVEVTDRFQPELKPDKGIALRIKGMSASGSRVAEVNGCPSLFGIRRKGGYHGGKSIRA